MCCGSNASIRVLGFVGKRKRYFIFRQKCMGICKLVENVLGIKPHIPLYIHTGLPSLKYHLAANYPYCCNSSIPTIDCKAIMHVCPYGSAINALQAPYCSSNDYYHLTCIVNAYLVQAIARAYRLICLIVRHIVIAAHNGCYVKCYLH